MQRCYCRCCHSKRRKSQRRLAGWRSTPARKSVDENTEDGLKFLEQHPVGYPVLADPTGKIGIPWGIRSLPRSFLLDREGRVVTIHKRFRAGDEIKLKRDITKLLDQ